MDPMKKLKADYLSHLYCKYVCYGLLGLETDNIWTFAMWSKPTSPARINDAISAYYDEMCVAMRRRGHSSSASQDIVHDIYVRLMGEPRLPENQSAVRAFLIRACINLGIDRFRREQFERRLFSGGEAEALAVVDRGVGAEAAADLAYRLKVLSQAISDMSRERRRVFLASAVAGLTSAEICETTGITKNMVDRHLRNAYLHCLLRLEDAL